MECEMCGKTVGVRKYMVEKNLMNLGVCCSRFGKPLDAPPAHARPTSSGSATRPSSVPAKSQSQQPPRAQIQFDLVEAFGKRIHDARERKGMTHEQLGTRVKASVAELKHIEQEKLRPSDDVARRMEKELGIVLLEEVKGGPGTALAGMNKMPNKGMTIGDILKDALNRE